MHGSVEVWENACHAQCAETMLRTNNGSILENQCHHVDPFPSHVHKFSYHQLKNHIRERPKNNHVSSVGQCVHRNPNIGLHRSKQTISKVKKQKQNIHVGHFHVQKKNAKEVCMEQIKDMPRVTREICEELHFERNNKCFTGDLETLYMGLTLNEKTFIREKYVFHARGHFKMEKCHNFQHQTK
jgi:hypothetical protein